MVFHLHGFCDTQSKPEPLLYIAVIGVQSMYAKRLPLVRRRVMWVAVQKLDPIGLAVYWIQPDRQTSKI